ncbi:asparagine synthase-related protein [Sulfurimonas sp. HSL1-2]|uniref:asparagine synthase-related protein n=1 Tax=Thiomicrolovo zhangzhouensis TaxID=3131933 RepID=UPI0031F7718D
MAGIYGVIAREALPEVREVYRLFFSASVEGTRNEEIVAGRMLFGRSVPDRFDRDRVLYEEGDVIIAFEGVCYNLGAPYDHMGKMLLALYREKGTGFVEEIDGNFSGFLLDRRTNTLLLFTDHLNTKPLYFFQNDAYFVFASELKVLSALLPRLGIKTAPDRNGILSLAAFGYVLDNATLLEDVRKLPYGTLMTLDIERWKVTQAHYFDFSAIGENAPESEAEMIERIDTLLTAGVAAQWRKDEAYGYKHYLFLSGGLDSRVNALLAHELGFTETTALTFAQRQSDDAVIAGRIAADYGFDYRFMPLDGGHYLEGDLTRFVAAGDGMNLLIGSAAGFDFLSRMDHRAYGTLHTGQIGDLLFGSYVKPSFSLQQAALTKERSLLESIEWFEPLRQRYENRPELFGYEQRVMHGTFNGDRSLAHFTDISSPFYNKELIRYCFGMPKAAKLHEGIYLKWINARHPSIAKYVWEQAGVRPTSVRKTVWGRQWKRYQNALRRRLGLSINDMNPFDQWYHGNPRLRKNLDTVFRERIEEVTDPMLRTLLLEMYAPPQERGHYGRYNKYLAVTVLLALELHFPGGKR